MAKEFRSKKNDDGSTSHYPIDRTTIGFRDDDENPNNRDSVMMVPKPALDSFRNNSMSKKGKMSVTMVGPTTKHGLQIYGSPMTKDYTTRPRKLQTLEILIMNLKEKMK